MIDNISIFIDNSLISKEAISYNDGLNFNRFFNNTVVKPFRVQISKEDFLSILEKNYNEVRDEIKEDDLLNNDSSDFKEVDYCSLQELLQKPKNLHSIFETYLRSFFFKELSQNRNAIYVMNSIDGIKVNEFVEIYGKAFVKS